MDSSFISMKSINELLVDDHGEPTRFWIPSYQRGYRWTHIQVTQLLDDIWEFIQNKNGGSFYCLQPLVVKTLNDGRVEVVDGQQRLTTIYIILTYLKKLVAVLDMKPFSLEFETRSEANDEILLDIGANLERKNEDVDIYHICKAYETVEEWFSSFDPTQRLEFVQHLLYPNDPNSSKRNVQVIWYETADENPVDAFLRLNDGKIPLTSDELVRALFLRRPAFSASDRDLTEGDKAKLQDSESLHLKIAYEWDQLEKSLQNDAFWYFLSNQKGKRENRISFLFEHIARMERDDEISLHDPLWVFYFYSGRLNESSGTIKNNEEWLKVKRTYMMLEEWYEDRTLFHIVGFLIYQGVDISDIAALANNKTKDAFESKLKATVYGSLLDRYDFDNLSNEELVDSVVDFVEGLNYKKHKEAIRSVLLLFNIATLLEDARSNIRFQFDSFKNEQWDIEHIRSVASERPERHHLRVAWLNMCVGWLQTPLQ